MISLLRQVLDRGLEINERLADLPRMVSTGCSAMSIWSNPDKRNLIWCMLAIR